MFERNHPFATMFTIAIVLGMTFWFIGGSRVKDLAPYYIKKALGQTAEVQIGRGVIKAEVVKSPRAQAKGLAGRDYLSLGRGMLFVFSEPGYYAFTMAKTKISLDIIWISEGKISAIVPHALPGSGIIEPGVEAEVVLEVVSNVADSLGWKKGDEVKIYYEEGLIHF
jgi:uncharacterized membrane protein (UPF0127 family)